MEIIYIIPRGRIIPERVLERATDYQLACLMNIVLRFGLEGEQSETKSKARTRSAQERDSLVRQRDIIRSDIRQKNQFIFLNIS